MPLASAATLTVGGSQIYGINGIDLSEEVPYHHVTFPQFLPMDYRNFLPMDYRNTAVGYGPDGSIIIKNLSPGEILTDNQGNVIQEIARVQGTLDPHQVTEVFSRYTGMPMTEPTTISIRNDLAALTGGHNIIPNSTGPVYLHGGDAHYITSATTYGYYHTAGTYTYQVTGPTIIDNEFQPLRNNPSSYYRNQLNKAINELTRTLIHTVEIESDGAIPAQQILAQAKLKAYEELTKQGTTRSYAIQRYGKTWDPYYGESDCPTEALYIRLNYSLDYTNLIYERIEHVDVQSKKTNKYRVTFKFGLTEELIAQWIEQLHDIQKKDEEIALKMKVKEFMRKNASIFIKKSSGRDSINLNIPPNEQKARDSLRDMLTEAEWRRYVTNGFIMVKGKSGLWYQVFNRRAERVRTYKDNKWIESICIHTDEKCPPTDHVINMKVMIEVDEELFRRGGNVHPRTAAAAQERMDEFRREALANPAGQVLQFNADGSLPLAGGGVIPADEIQRMVNNVSTRQAMARHVQGHIDRGTIVPTPEQRENQNRLLAGLPTANEVLDAARKAAQIENGSLLDFYKKSKQRVA